MNLFMLSWLNYLNDRSWESCLDSSSLKESGCYGLLRFLDFLKGKDWPYGFTPIFHELFHYYLYVSFTPNFIYDLYYPKQILQNSTIFLKHDTRLLFKLKSFPNFFHFYFFLFHFNGKSERIDHLPCFYVFFLQTR